MKCYITGTSVAFSMLFSLNMAQASLPDLETADAVSSSIVEGAVAPTAEVKAFVRIVPTETVERSHVYEVAPQLALEEVTADETEVYAKSEAPTEEVGQQGRQARSDRRSNRRQAKQVRCLNEEVGKASFYWQPQPVASGGRFNPNAMTAAHRTMPFGAQVKVTNMKNGKSVVVKINDRGPFVPGRIIDLSRASFALISPLKQGVTPVKMELVSCQG